MSWAGGEADNDRPGQEGPAEEALWRPRAQDLTWPESGEAAGRRRESQID